MVMWKMSSILKKVMIIIILKRAPVYEKYMECTALCRIHDYVDLRSFRIIIGS